MLVVSLSQVVITPASADPVASPFDSPDYIYQKLWESDDAATNGVRWPDYNAIAGKIVWTDGNRDGYIADFNPTTLQLSNIVSFGEGKLVYTPNFSKDGQYICYQDVTESSMTSLEVTGGTINAYVCYRYEIATGTTDVIFDISTIEPTVIEALTSYVGEEFGFYLGPDTSSDEVLMCVRDGNGQMDIVRYNINDKTFVNLTNSEQAEYDGRYFGTDNSSLLYWTENYPTHDDRRVVVLNAGTETEIATTTVPDMYLSARWGQDQNHVMAMQGTAWTNTDLVMFTYDGSWSAPEDLTGPGWSAVNGGLSIGASVENGFIFGVRNNTDYAGLWVAMLHPNEVWVDDDYTAENCGGHAWQYSAFDTIQDANNAAAEGATVHVAAGTYVEAVTITKPLTLLGATWDVNKNGNSVPGGYSWDENVESIIVHPNPTVAYNAIVDIVDTDDVTFKGFVVQELNAVDNLNSSLVRVYAHTREISNIVVGNNIIGPNTNITVNDGTDGRMGLYIVNHPYSDQYGVVNSDFSGNKIFGCEGNGNNVFIWSSYECYGATGPASMEGTVIEDNEIYGAHRSGIETAGGYTGLTIQNNKIYGNGGDTIPGKPELMFGNGVLLVRGSGDSHSDTMPGYGPTDLTFKDNEVYNNQRNGVYAGPLSKGFDFTDNDIHDNGWDGVQIDLAESYNNPDFETGDRIPWPDQIENIALNFNKIYGNGQYQVRVIGDPTNGFILDATNNWWGSNQGPSAMPENVTCNPWLVIKASANPISITADGASTSEITADLTKNSDGEDTSSLGHIPNGTQINFTTNKGDLITANAETVNGKAKVTLTSSSSVETASVKASAPPYTPSSTASTVVFFTKTSTNVDPENVKTEETLPGDVTVDAKAEADTEVSKSGGGTPQVVVAKYNSNPGTGFSGDIGIYFDVYIDDSTDVDEIIIRSYYTDNEIAGKNESSLRLKWFDGTEYIFCSDSWVDTTDIVGPPAYSGVISIRLTATSVPSINDLTGSIFGGYAASLGGGGGGGGTPSLSFDFFGWTSETTISPSGLIKKEITAASPDGELTVVIKKDTQALDKNKNALSSLKVRKTSLLPADPPEDKEVISAYYDFSPEGATFQPGIVSIWSYKLPENVSAESLVVLYYDKISDSWVEVASEVDAVGNKVTAAITHFSIYALAGKVVTPEPVEPPPTSTTTTPAPGPELTTTTPAPPESTETTPTLTTTTTTPKTTVSTTTPSAKKANWTVIGSIIGAVGAVIVIVAVVLIVRKRKKDQI